MRVRPGVQWQGVSRGVNERSLTPAHDPLHFPVTAAMTPSKISKSGIAQVLAKTAAQIPGTTTGVACAGTALESQTFVSAAKAYVFIGKKEARLKLGESLSEAQRLSKQLPESLRVGAGGWVAIRVDGIVGPGTKVLERWVRESHGLMTTAKK